MAEWQSGPPKKANKSLPDRRTIERATAGNKPVLRSGRERLSSTSRDTNQELPVRNDCSSRLQCECAPSILQICWRHMLNAYVREQRSPAGAATWGRDRVGGVGAALVQPFFNMAHPGQGLYHDLNRLGISAPPGIIWRPQRANPRRALCRQASRPRSPRRSSACGRRSRTRATCH